VCLLLVQVTGAAGREPQAHVTDTKQEVIQFEKAWWEAFKTRDTAVAAVHYSAHDTVNGKASSDRAIDLDTLVRRNGRWQAVATGEVHVTTSK
jgi:hypothetical protein